ncbi:MAG: hypothetical protein COX51_08890 [Syntrophobacteraceae bacterium CG23_combo_of_CG06-09_8_20_14_all_50_8]|nr:MAG: hypothetical protein COX51_08890 [Syntrophobacteraceae bacterium CG23_combo_of_CG06-09_8_20_14_all_50_8]
MVDDQSALVKELQAKFAEKIKESEIDSLKYWKEQLDRVLATRPEGVAALQLQIKRISGMMANRINTLKAR